MSGCIHRVTECNRLPKLSAQSASAYRTRIVTPSISIGLDNDVIVRSWSTIDVAAFRLVEHPISVAPMISRPPCGNAGMINNALRPGWSSRTMSFRLTPLQGNQVARQVTQTVLPAEALRVLDSAVHAVVPHALWPGVGRWEGACNEGGPQTFHRVSVNLHSCPAPWSHSGLRGVAACIETWCYSEQKPADRSRVRAIAGNLVRSLRA
jgi:hypothetical protein